MSEIIKRCKEGENLKMKWWKKKNNVYGKLMWWARVKYWLREGKWPVEKSETPVWDWFELTYAQYLTVPRLVMQSMPLRWQRKMVRLLREMDEEFDWRPAEGNLWVKLNIKEWDCLEENWEPVFVDPPYCDYRHGSVEHLRRKKK